MMPEHASSLRGSTEEEPSRRRRWKFLNSQFSRLFEKKVKNSRVHSLKSFNVGINRTMPAPSPSQQQPPRTQSQATALRVAVSDAAADAARGACAAVAAASRRESGTALVAAAASSTASARGDAALERACRCSRVRVPEQLAAGSAAAAVVLHNLEPLMDLIGKGKR